MVKGTTKAELIAHTVCVLFVIAGLALIWITADETNSGGQGNRNAIVFTFFMGFVLSVSMLVNAGRCFNGLIPLSMAIGYFFYPGAIDFADLWRKELENDTDDRQLAAKTSDLRLLLTGAVFCLFGTLLNIVSEVLFVKPGVNKSTNVVLRIFTVIAAGIALVGCIVVWIYNDDRRENDFADHLRISLQGLIALMFGMDSALHFDHTLVVVAIFMAMFTACEAFVKGIRYEDFDDDSDETRKAAGLLLLSVGLFFLVGFNVLMKSSNVSKATTNTVEA